MVLPVALRVLAKAGLYYGISRVLTEGFTAKEHVRRMIIGIALLIGALFVAGSAMLAFTAGVFFSLSEAEAYIRPAFITGGVVLLISLLLGWEGWRRVKISSRR
ncbi:MAG: phage holin family protein [Candidatus Andersenbacteria bacterium]|nr:phage holin family protein [Candidatus Andersenbacteria bacterium]MBI3251225.1 phage holin family protein [Candidatus Andersenbacteria bacterium]